MSPYPPMTHPPPPNFALANGPQIREILDRIIASPEDVYVLTTNSPTQARTLRSRMNKVRGQRRVQAEAVVAAQRARGELPPKPNEFADDYGVTPWDRLTFRVDGPDVLVCKEVVGTYELLSAIRTPDGKPLEADPFAEWTGDEPAPAPAPSAPPTLAPLPSEPLPPPKEPDPFDNFNVGDLMPTNPGPGAATPGDDE